MKLKSICCIAVLTALTMVAHTSAQNLSATYIGINPGISAKGTFDGSNYRFVDAGLAQFDGFEGFCIEPLQGLSIDDVVDYTAFSYPPGETGQSISKLVGNYYSSGQTDTEAAATQWAIWEVLIDGPDGSLASGNSRVLSASVSNLANDYLGQLPTLPTIDVVFLENSERQDMATTVPEPASLSLILLSSLLLFRRKR